MSGKRMVYIPVFFSEIYTISIVRISYPRTTGPYD